MTEKEAIKILNNTPVTLSATCKTTTIEYHQMLHCAENALEKQISKKVKHLNRHGDGEDLWNKDYFNCPSCGRRLRNKQKDKHCGRCGQALDWTDDNE